MLNYLLVKLTRVVGFSLDSVSGCFVSHWSLVICNEANEKQEVDAGRLSGQDGCAELIPSPSQGPKPVTVSITRLVSSRASKICPSKSAFVLSCTQSIYCCGFASSALQNVSSLWRMRWTVLVRSRSIQAKGARREVAASRVDGMKWSQVSHGFQEPENLISSCSVLLSEYT